MFQGAFPVLMASGARWPPLVAVHCDFEWQARELEVFLDRPRPFRRSPTPPAASRLPELGHSRSELRPNPKLPSHSENACHGRLGAAVMTGLVLTASHRLLQQLRGTFWAPPCRTPWRCTEKLHEFGRGVDFWFPGFRA